VPLVLIKIASSSEYDSKSKASTNTSPLLLYTITNTNTYLFAISLFKHKLAQLTPDNKIATGIACGNVGIDPIVISSRNSERRFSA